MTKGKLLFSITKKCFELEFFCAGGPGGQYQNKTATACRIRHPESGAVAESRTHRTQLQNKKAAFERLLKTAEFKKWHKLRCAKALGQELERRSIDEVLDDWMRPENLKIEILGE